MKPHIMRATMILLTGLAILPAVAFGQDTPGVTGAGAASFPAGTLYAATPISALQFGMGVFVPGDGSASGHVLVTLMGTSLLGVPIEIELDGEATAGVINPDGSGMVSGNGSLNLGDGLPPLTGVPYIITATASTLSLIINSITLPLVPLSDGVITIQ
jgi:hypothetical protein